MDFKTIIQNTVYIITGVLLACIVGEIIVRIGSYNQENYVVEMWRYAKLLKQPSKNQNVGHEHIPSSHARLQNVDIYINSYGMRGPKPNLSAKHRVVIIGDSMAFGWGTEDSDCLRGQLDAALPDDYDVINAGIGNMNLFQSVSLWQDLRKRIDADTLVVVTTQRATARRAETHTGFFVRNSQLIALASTMVTQLVSGEYGHDALVDGYRKQWLSPGGEAILTDAFRELKREQVENGKHIIILCVPETHDLNNYRFDFITQKIQEHSKMNGFTFVDALPLLQGHSTDTLWVCARDIHLNGTAFGFITEALVPIIANHYQDSVDE